MSCHLTDEELWSGLDRNAPELRHHIAECPRCRSRAGEFQAGIDAVTTVATPATLPIPENVGPYRVIRRLGEGGMGIVYEAEQQSPVRPVAIKVVRGGRYVDQYRVKLFQREAQVLARLRHPAIGAIYEAGQTPEGQDYFAMELVHGAPLNAHVKEGPTPRHARLRLFCRICEAIHYAHLRGVIHRDLKPSNILIDTDGNPKILDFGLARITDPDAELTVSGTEVGRIMGTLPYMSPEEARGDIDRIDVRSDVYSLGVILYELLSDRLPYNVRKAVLHEAVRTICEVSPRRPASLDRSLRGDLETIVLKALAKEGPRRYQSAAALAEDVERYLADQPILARPAGSLYRLRKLVVRHQFFCFILLVIVGVVTGAALWVRQSEGNLQAGLVDNMRLRDRAVAVLQQRLGEETFAQEEKFPQAEPLFRSALRAFKELEVDDRALKVRLMLAQVLIRIAQRAPPDSVQTQYEEAEEFLLEALDVVDRDPKKWQDEYRSALEMLVLIYHPDRYDYHEGLVARQSELDALATPPTQDSPAPRSGDMGATDRVPGP